MRRSIGAVASTLLLLLTTVVVASPDARGATGVLCRLHDDRIDEASGIARGVTSPHVLYVQNDSGDTNRFFALDAHTCETVATVTVPGAGSVDWEDIAVARDAAGTPSVWIGDIGDNDARRSSVAVYRVDEPRVAGGDRELRTPRPDVWRLRYPNGPVDAESLAVAPGGAAYIVTKSYLGRSTVYRLPRRADAQRVQTLAAVGTIRFTPHDIANPLAAAREMAATSAAISADGSRFVVRTYTDAYVWTLGNADLAAALRDAPTRVTLPDQPQGEGVTFDANALLLDSERQGSAIITVALPRRADATSSPSPSSSSPTSATPSGGSTRPSGASSSSAAKRGSGGHGSWLPGLIILTLLVLGASGWWTLQLRGRAGR